MGTPNFARPQNASKYFVVLTDKEEEVKVCKECNTVHYESEHDFKNLNECEECESTDLEQKTESVYPAEYEYVDLMHNLELEFKDQLEATIGGRIFNDRSHHRASIAEFCLSKTYGDVEVEIKFEIIIQSGYYQGATLDYLISISNGFDFVEFEDNHDEMIEELFDLTWDDTLNSDMNKGLRVILSKHAKKWLEETIADTSKKIEEIFETFSDNKLNLIGTASNGEAFYCEPF